MSQIDTSTTASKIADSLFSSGLGGNVTRLVLEMERGGDGGGLCRGAVIDRIRAILDSELDPYADLKAAVAKGRSIDIDSQQRGVWSRVLNTNDLSWNLPVACYRIAPLEFPEPPVGEQWHNPAGVTAEQVEIDKGYRLLTKSENLSAREDRFQLRPEGDREAWIKGSGIWDGHKNCGDAGGITYRTRLPLPTPKKRVPLECADYGDGPWEICDNPAAPYPSIDLVVSYDYLSVVLATHGCEPILQRLRHEEIVGLSRRKVGTDTWLPCDKEAE